MPRSRVLSFMSQWGGPPRSPTSEAPPSPTSNKPPISESRSPARKPLDIDTTTPQASAMKLDTYAQGSPKSPAAAVSRARGDSRLSNRPLSMMQTYQPPQVDVAQDTPPELQPIFSFLNSHSNKLYQEGYFLKLHDLDSRGRPSPDRVWTECFAQLVGTVLSLWDAAALDVAGEDGEVVPTFINLSDASIKMIESLPMNGAQGGNLQNVLSISTAANNRYLLHFNSLSSLTQWTAGIRLAMFEHATLQEAYTGSLIAGKGRLLNNIKNIMERSRFAYEDWTRVRFGAGTPWRRCWCVISPPDEKEYARAQKVLKKSSTYERVKIPKGDIKFYESRKVTKKTKPIATITDAYAAYAIYPQSKPLIDQSTLVKLEGLVTVHGPKDTTSEGFVFVMPEVHAAVTGFEMMLRWLFPVWDTFALYGRPNRLIADTLDQRGLMFAMPRDRRYGYLDSLDASGLIHTQGSQAWSERQWRREMKKLTSERMVNQLDQPASTNRQFSQRRSTMSRAPMQQGAGGIRFEDGGSVHSSPGSRSASPAPFGVGDGMAMDTPRRTDSAPPGIIVSPHKRSVSDAQGYRKYVADTPSRLSYSESRGEEETPPPPPKHGGALGASAGRSQGPGSLGRIQSGAEVPTMGSYDGLQPPAAAPSLPPPAPVLSPPAFTHNPNSRPATQPYQAPELRRAHSNVDAATLYQMQDAVRRDDTPEGEWVGEVQHRQQQNLVASHTLANRSLGLPADRSQGLATAPDHNRSRDPRQRLSTIEGSPYVGDGTETFQSPEEAYLTPPQHDGADDRQQAVLTEQRPSLQEGRLSRPHSDRSVARKPVPTAYTEVAPEPTTLSIPQDSHAASDSVSDSPVNDESWEGALIDTAALERILDSGSERHYTMQSTQSHASSATPDYASTVESVHSAKKSIEKQRTGKLKTVGDPSMQPLDTRFDPLRQAAASKKAPVPAIDFGPTYSMMPKSRPGTSGTITLDNLERSRSRSGDRLRERSRDRLTGSGSRSPMPRISPGTENNRHSYFGSQTTPSPVAVTPTEYTIDGMNIPGNRNSIAWQPGSSPMGGQPDRRSVTAEQWVQQRAAMAAQPQAVPARKTLPSHAHQRQTSSNSVHQLRKSMTKTPPPLSRTPSGDWTQQARQNTPPSRPHSRGAGAYLNPPSPGGMLNTAQSTSLTAKEQMHVARATGTPLLNYTSKADKKQQEQYQPGLFGALAAREREKEDLNKASGRRNMHNPVVQHAIASRQQQLEAEAQMQAQANYQLQMQQAAQQAQQALQMQQMQQLQYQQMMLAQGGAPQGYPMAQQQPQPPQQRPAAQSRNSWHLSQYGAPSQYGALSQYGAPSQYGGGQQQDVGNASPGTPGTPGGTSPFAMQQAVLPGQSNRSSFYGGSQQGAQQYQQQQRRAY